MRQDRHDRRLAELEATRALIQRSADDLERGALISAETFFRGWDAELEAAEQSNAS